MGNRVVSQAIPKVDYKALVTGKAVYTDDLAAKDSLVVKVLRSPHAHALIQDINLTRAELVPDIDIQRLSGQAVYDGGTNISGAESL